MKGHPSSRTPAGIREQGLTEGTGGNFMGEGDECKGAEQRSLRVMMLFCPDCVDVRVCVTSPSWKATKTLPACCVYSECFGHFLIGIGGVSLLNGITDSHDKESSWREPAHLCWEGPGGVWKDSAQDDILTSRVQSRWWQEECLGDCLPSAAGTPYSAWEFCPSVVLPITGNGQGTREGAQVTLTLGQGILTSVSRKTVSVASSGCSHCVWHQAEEVSCTRMPWLMAIMRGLETEGMRQLLEPLWCRRVGRVTLTEATYPRHGFDHCFFHPLSSWPPGVATEDFSRGAQMWIAEDVCQEAGNAEEMQSWKWPPGDPGKDRMPMLMNQETGGYTFMVQNHVTSRDLTQQPNLNSKDRPGSPLSPLLLAFPKLRRDFKKGLVRTESFFLVLKFFLNSATGRWK
ncbi:hypothetical protein Cadr_000025321 [Camelus dromedarius]|uniref:Uncharacterized protein n=1 Tax=Camelus dromedarius TaxID=9838 RepID=A0A5N4CMB8_CAMDR|nr:hypothetical protein Cadr_000025321 [Camelus dromedarius]